ncbi:MAG: ArsI/CadI family heavy metal resistance metalloenzyme [Steroidobacteraceae bacterium]
MKRFHVHVAVNELTESVRFYTAVFGAEPSVLRADYAKWMLDDPRINFAISKRGHPAGINHLGFQVDGDVELHEMRTRLEGADASLIEQTGQDCCYAKSDKYWITDPQGIAWETFHTLGTMPVYGEDGDVPSTSSACCTPLAQVTREDAKDTAPRCVPTRADQGASGSCC